MEVWSKMEKMIDNAAVPSGVFGIAVGFLHDCGNEILILFSIMLILCQLLRMFYKFIKWARG